MSEHKNCECTSEHKDCECTKDFMGCQRVSDYYVPDLTWLEKKNDPLPQPAGASVCVSSVPELMAAVSHAAEGSVILIADGEYQLTGSIVLEKDGITLKGQSGDRDRVVILGNGFYGEGPGKMDQAILVQCACNITIADLTIKEFCTNGISVQAWSDPTPHGVHIHNVKFINVGERPVKINGGGFTGHIENGIIENCYFEVTKTVSPDRPDGFGGDYIAGIDAHRTKGWIIRDNIFINIKGATGVGRGAIFVWNDAYDTIIERNLIIGCDRGIALGNPMVPGPGEYWWMTDGIVRNNIIVSPKGQMAFEIIKARGTKILNNTVFCEDPNYERCFYYAHPTTDIVIKNNLVFGSIRSFENAKAQLDGNVTQAQPEWFSNPADGDLRLSERALEDKLSGESLEEVTDDFFGKPRTGSSTKGACQI